MVHSKDVINFVKNLHLGIIADQFGRGSPKPDVRRCCSNLYGHMDGHIMFVCSSDASNGQSSKELVASWGHESSYN